MTKCKVTKRKVAKRMTAQQIWDVLQAKMTPENTAREALKTLGLRSPIPERIRAELRRAIMTVFTKDLTSPEVIEALKKEGKVLLEVTIKRHYIVSTGEDVPRLMADWFVHWNGRSHAYRDGCHVGGGGDAVQQVRDITDEGKVVFNLADVAHARGDAAGYAAFSAGQGKPANPYVNEDPLAAEWDAGYREGFDRCGRDKQAAFEFDIGRNTGWTYDSQT